MRTAIFILLLFPLVQAAHLLLNSGIWPDICPLILRHFNFQDVGRLKRVCVLLNLYLKTINVDWMPVRQLSQEERGQLVEAVNQNDWIAAKTMLKSGPVYLGFDYGYDLGTRCLMTDVARRGSIELLELLLNHGLKITDYRFLYALENCMACKRYDMLRYMMQKHPSLSQIDGAQRILCQACENSVRALPEAEIRWMLETFQAARDWINAPFYQQPVHMARNAQVLSLLLDFGARPNAQRMSDLKTKLHMIMYEVPVLMRPAMIQCLLDAGADVHLKDVLGYTPLQLLMRNCPDEVSKNMLLLHLSNEQDPNT